MKHFTKAICVIDTCSILNLDGIELARDDVLRYIRQFFDVHVSDVILDEFNRHRKQLGREEASYWSSTLSSKQFQPQVLTSNETVIAPFYTHPPASFGAEDAGEHANARVAIELLLTKAAGHAIFVTDDLKACSAFLNKMRGSFPGINLWSSADVVLYLGAILLTERRVTYDAIKNALRDVYARRGSFANTDQYTSQVIKRRKQSAESLKLIAKIANNWS